MDDHYCDHSTVHVLKNKLYKRKSQTTVIQGIIQ